MLKRIFQKLLQKAGKTYSIDDRIPSRLIYRTLFKRVIMMIRGYCKVYKKIFIGKNCSILNKNNIQFGSNITIEHHSLIDGFASEKIVLGNNVKIGAYTSIISTSHFAKYGKGLKIGNNSAIGQYSEIGAAGGIEIGNDVIMGSYISFHSENHNFEDTTKPIREQGVSSKGIKLGNNIWVGAKVTFLDGSEVGDNSVVAAGAVVNGIYPPNSVIGGVPAKILKTL